MKFWIGFILVCACVAAPASAKETRSGVDSRGMDQSVRPQDDLFMYMNGEWLKHTPIPADKSSYGSFEILGDESEANIREIITVAVEGENPAGSDLQKIGDFFQSYMDEETIESRGMEPLREELAKIDRLDELNEVVEHLGYLQTIDVTGPIGFYVDQDDKRFRTSTWPSITQSGTALARSRLLSGETPPSTFQARAGPEGLRRAGCSSWASFPEDGADAAETVLSPWRPGSLRSPLGRALSCATPTSATTNTQVDQLVGVSRPRFPWYLFFEAAGVAGFGAPER